MSQQFGHNSNRARLSQAQAGTSGLQPLGQQGQVGPAGVGASIQPQGGFQLTGAGNALPGTTVNAVGADGSPGSGLASGCCGTEKRAHPVAHVNTRQGLPLDRAWSLMPRDYGCCGTEKPAKRGEVESPLRLGQRPNECDALANRASCEAHPVAHVNTRQGLSALRRYLLYIYIALAASPSLLTSGRCGNPPGGGHRNFCPRRSARLSRRPLACARLVFSSASGDWLSGGEQPPCQGPANRR